MRAITINRNTRTNRININLCPALKGGSGV